MIKKIVKGLEMTRQFYHDEIRNIRRDSGALLILVGAMLIYPLAYSIAYKNEVIRELKTTIVDLDQTTTSRQLVRMLNGTEQIHINREANSLDEAKKDFYDGNSGGIVVVPKKFEKDILSGKQTNVAVFADGSYFLIYRQLISGSVSAVGTFSAGVEIKKLMLEGKSYDQALEMRDPLKADIHFWFNPNSGYAAFVMPGIIIVILQQTLLIGIGMVGGTAREEKRENFMVPLALKRGGVLPILGAVQAARIVHHVHGISIAHRGFPQRNFMANNLHSSGCLCFGPPVSFHPDDPGLPARARHGRWHSGCRLRIHRDAATSRCLFYNRSNCPVFLCEKAGKENYRKSSVTSGLKKASIS